MSVCPNKVVSFNYTLTDKDGAVIDQSLTGDFAYLHGADNIVPGLERAMEGRQVGDSFSVVVPAEEGYGERHEEMVERVSRAMFEGGDEIEPGMQFHAESGDGQMILITVVAVEEDEVVIDGNHPLAGVDLNFAVDIVAIRDATAEEIAHGHAHGAHGHHHH